MPGIWKLGSVTLLIPVLSHQKLSMLSSIALVSLPGVLTQPKASTEQSGEKIDLTNTPSSGKSAVGLVDGLKVGLVDGDTLGLVVGDLLGETVGDIDGARVGDILGSNGSIIPLISISPHCIESLLLG